MLIATLVLFSAYVIGLAVRIVFLKAYDKDYEFKNHTWQVIACGVTGLALSLLIGWLTDVTGVGYGGWIGFLMFVVAGFLSKYIAEFLNRTKG